MRRVRAYAPGRVNLIGDHTDYTGGFVCPMAIDLGTTVEGQTGGAVVRLTSADESDEAFVPLTGVDPLAMQPPWARYVAGVVSVLRPTVGFTGHVHSTVPPGAGLSSSSALTVALALALGFEGSPVELARLCQQAEIAGSGVPGGIMDQLTAAAGVEGHALLIDCSNLAITPVKVPLAAEVVVVHSGEQRRLVGSAYAERRAQCEAASAIVGPLRTAALGALGAIDDEVVLRRARHVVTENARVLAFAGALGAGDLSAAGRLMVESHISLGDDFEVSTPALDALVDRLVGMRGVYGARLTGAGFGGCVVALADARAVDRGVGWHVRPMGGATRS